MSIAKKVTNNIHKNERTYLGRNYETCSTIVPVRESLDLEYIYNTYIPTNEVVSIYPVRTEGSSDDTLVADFSPKKYGMAYFAIAFKFVDDSVLGVVVDRYMAIDSESTQLCVNKTKEAQKIHETKLVDCFVKHCYEVLHDSKSQF